MSNQHNYDVTLEEQADLCKEVGFNPEVDVAETYLSIMLAQLTSPLLTREQWNKVWSWKKAYELGLLVYTELITALHTSEDKVSIKHQRALDICRDYLKHEKLHAEFLETLNDVYASAEA